MSTPGQCYQWIIEGDISSYFDSIPHRKLIKSVKKRVKDDQMLSLLWAFLKSGIMEEGEIRNSMTGTPQGGVVTPRTQRKTFVKRNHMFNREFLVHAIHLDLFDE
jgi:retron-type reverse transcriptase